MDDEAVSPVIGVILMVAITVVLAAVVFVLVSGLSQTDGQPPAHLGALDEGEDRYKIIRGVENDASEYQWKASAAGVRYAENGQATGASPLVPTSYATFGSGPWDAGVFYDFCGDAGDVSDWTLTIRHVDTNGVVADVDFLNIAAC